MRLDYRATQGELIERARTLREQAAKADAIYNALSTATPQQVSNWVDANVTSFEDVKKLLKLLLIKLL
jgi:hypothetical protein